MSLASGIASAASMASFGGVADAPGVDWRGLLECPLCLSMLSSPVVTPCGHTFCSECLAKALATSPQCPLCRAPCYLQANYRLGRKPVVVLEKLLEIARGQAPSNGRIQLDTEPTQFRLGLFFLSERYFSPVPFRTIKLRAFEPYVLLLVRRCVEQGVRLGIQPSKDSNHGYLVRVDRISPFPDRFYSHHLLVQCYIEGLYKICGPLEEEPSTGGLNYALVEEIRITEDLDDRELESLCSQAKRHFENAIRRLQPSEVTSIFEDVYSGTMRAVPEDPVELSYFLIEALTFPSREIEEAIVFEPSVKKRLEACIELLDVDEVDFKRITSKRALLRTRETLDMGRNVLLASGVMVFLGVAMGGMDAFSWLPFFRRQ